jgi:hypothetical protein
MSNNHKILSETQQIIMDEQGKPRKPYRKPQLQVLGDLRTLTLGGSPGIGESGAGGYPEFPGPGHFPLP